MHQNEPKWIKLDYYDQDVSKLFKANQNASKLIKANQNESKLIINIPVNLITVSLVGNGQSSKSRVMVAGPRGSSMGITLKVISDFKMWHYFPKWHVGEKNINEKLLSSDC